MWDERPLEAERWILNDYEQTQTHLPYVQMHHVPKPAKTVTSG